MAKISFSIQYNTKQGDSVETTSCVDKGLPGRQLLHDLLDEFLDNGWGEHAPKSDDPAVEARFIVHGRPCETHK